MAHEPAHPLPYLGTGELKNRYADSTKLVEYNGVYMAEEQALAERAQDYPYSLARILPAARR